MGAAAVANGANEVDKTSASEAASQIFDRFFIEALHPHPIAKLTNDDERAKDVRIGAGTWPRCWAFGKRLARLSRHRSSV